MIYELAGVVGVDPGPLTLRELLWMSEGCRRELWSHTSLVCATMMNLKGISITAEELHPMMGKQSQKPVRVGIEALKVFVKGGRKDDRDRGQDEGSRRGSE